MYSESENQIRRERLLADNEHLRNELQERASRYSEEKEHKEQLLMLECNHYENRIIPEVKDLKELASVMKTIIPRLLEQFKYLILNENDYCVQKLLKAMRTKAVELSANSPIETLVPTDLLGCLDWCNKADRTQLIDNTDNPTQEKMTLTELVYHFCKGNKNLTFKQCHERIENKLGHEVKSVPSLRNIYGKAKIKQKLQAKQLES